MASALPLPRRNTNTTSKTKQHTPIQILLQMGFPKHRAEKALAATGHRGVQLASDWLLAHVNDPLLDDNSPREYILYACPTGDFLQQLQHFWEKSKEWTGWNGAHNYTPHITLVSFFKAPDEDSLHLSDSLKSVMDRQGAMLNEPLKLETYISPNFMGFFVAEEHGDYLKRIAMQFVKEVSNAILSDTYEHFDALTACFPWCTTTTARCIPRGSRSISLEPHVKSLHLTLAYQFSNFHYVYLKELVEELDPKVSGEWELRLYSRDPRFNGMQVHKVIEERTPSDPAELELRIGDYVYVTQEEYDRCEDGWLEGTSWLTGLSGLLTVSAIERTTESDAWTLHRKVSFTQTNNTNNKNMSSAAATSTSDVKESKCSNNDDASVSSSGAEEEYKLPDPTYENVANLKTANSSDEISQPHNHRRIFIMRHGERVDFTFGSWIPYCFDESGKYLRKDLNMPLIIPERKLGPKGYLRDSPITNVGVFQASMIGKALRENNVNLDHVYCSPSFRSIQTCDAVLKALNKKDEIKIKIEPGLFEWLQWYPEGLPDWLTAEELLNAGYNIDKDYVPFVSGGDLRLEKETLEMFYRRSILCTRGALSVNSTGNIFLVGHAATLETCSRELIGEVPRTANEMTRAIQKVPYCSVLQLTYAEDKWEITEPPFPPITHSINQRFDWKVLLQ